MSSAAAKRFRREVPLFVVFAILLLGHLPALACSDFTRDPRDHIVERDWIEDSTNNLGPDQVRSIAWTPFSGSLRRGYTSSPTCRFKAGRMSSL